MRGRVQHLSKAALTPEWGGLGILKAPASSHDLPHRAAGAPGGELDQSCWMGLLVVEMVHEASLLHDDFLDEAPERRSKPTLVAASGVGPALELGDHLLTAAYRVAAEVGSTSFMEAFVRAVERTVAGEIAQERSQGRVLAADLDRREGYAGQVTGVGLLDEVLGEMGRSGVPSRYAEGLVEGVGMDLFPSLDSHGADRYGIELTRSP
jgi:hypothetical protein